jgi:hypothetical protein
MKEDIDQMTELLFQQCRFDPLYMDEEFTRQRCRLALESLSDEEYKHFCTKLKGI